MTLGLRSRSLERLAASASTPLDVLVVGGGITGAGIALDVAARGLSVGLVEKGDFASGTSSKSSKLVHGGLRYLAQGELGLVREAVAERDLMRRLAPHLVRAINFVVPVTGRSARAKLSAGLWAYDALAAFRAPHFHKHLGSDEIEGLVPALPKGTVRGGFLYHDCQTDDVRLVMEVLVAAARHGAAAVNYAEVTGIEPGRAICSVRVHDGLGGEVFEIRARRVLVAAGVWADAVESLIEPNTRRLRPSKGVHLVLARSDLPVAEAAVLIPDALGKRMLFIAPWLGRVLVGTTDTPYDAGLEDVSVEPDDYAYCLDALNKTFDLSLGADDVVAAFAGLRPLLAGRAGATADLSRRHVLYDIAPGVTGITGGKLTTWRRMAGAATDRALGTSGKSFTRRLRLGSSDLGALRAAVGRRSDYMGIAPRAADELVRCYGDRALAVLDVAAEHDLRGPLVAGHAHIAAEAIYCARAEMTVELEDLLVRRTRLAFIDRGGGIDDGVAADLLASELGWDTGQSSARISRYRASLERERGRPLPTAATGDQLAAGEAGA